MARDNTVQITGNLTREPALKFLNSGTAVCELGVAWNPPGRRNDNGGFDEQPPHFFDVTCWGELAEHVAESLKKGQRVTVVGNLEYRAWEDNEGNKRSKVEIRADEVGPSLRWATADVTRAERGGNGAAKAGARSGVANTGVENDEEPF